MTRKLRAFGLEKPDMTSFFRLLGYGPHCMLLIILATGCDAGLWLRSGKIWNSGQLDRSSPIFANRRFPVLRSGR
jgi:hypothetical protein